MLKCGMCETDITPALGLSIPGYFSGRPATGIKDRLYAKALVLDNRGKILVIIALDTIMVLKETVDAIRKRITVFTGIPGENIMVSATHTHTGGPVSSILEGDYNEEEFRYLIEKAADAAVIAYNIRKPAGIGFGAGTERDIAFNRRYYMKDGSVQTNPGFKNPDIVKPAGSIDPEVTVIRIDDADGNPMGVVTSYACHLDTIGGNEYSADYPGEMSRVIKKVLGQDVVSMFLTGPCGNINHINTDVDSIPKDHYKKMGRILAGEVLKVREKIVLGDEVPLDVLCSTLKGDIRQPSKEDTLKAKVLLKAIHERNTDITKDEQREMFFAKGVLYVYNDPNKQYDIEMQAMIIGDLTVSAMPCELFVEFGLDIKKRSPAKYNIVNTLANGSYGYIAVREAFGQGGYEVRINKYTKMAPETGYKMTDSVIKLIEGMHKEM